MSKRCRHILWSGGFDSTALMLRHLRKGRKVLPYVFTNDAGKQPYERLARENILAALTEKERKLILPQYTMDYPTIRAIPAYKHFVQSYMDHANAVKIGPQFGLIRFLQDACDLPRLQMGIVVGDGLWHCQQNDQPGLASFCCRWTFPLWQKTKFDLWQEAPKRHKKILRLTWSCEDPQKDKTCRERKVKLCRPCMRSLEIPMEQNK